MCGSRGGTGSPDHPPDNHKAVGFLRSSGMEPLKNHRATQLVFSVGPTLARQQNATQGMAFR